MPIRFELSEDQLKYLSIIRDLGSKTILRIVAEMEKLDYRPFKPDDLREHLKRILPKPDLADILTQQLLSLFNLVWKQGISVDELLDGLNSGIIDSECISRWNKSKIEKWESLRPALKKLFSIEALSPIVEAMELSYDSSSNLFENAKILTEIRPVFNQDASKMEGAMISYSLRLTYRNSNGVENLIIDLDDDDIKKLNDQCAGALNRANLIKKTMQEYGLTSTYIIGEDES